MKAKIFKEKKGLVTRIGGAIRHKEVGFVMKKSCVVVISGIIIASLAVLSTGHAAEQRIDLKALAAKRVPILLEFGRGWCIPCKYMKPILEETAKAYAGKAIVTTVDMDANKDLVRTFGIRMMPTQVFLTPDGKEFFRNEGTLEREQIAQVFQKMGVAAPGQQGALPAHAPQASAPQGQGGTAR